MIRLILVLITLAMPFWTLGQEAASRYYSYSCLSLSGNSVSHSNFYCRSTIGQPNPTTTITQGQFMIRQGFQQPIRGSFRLITKPQAITKLSLYPNPSSGIINLYVELESKGDFQYRIMDTGGRLISSGYGKSEILLEIEDLFQKPSGLYFLLISTPFGEHLTTQRVMVN